MDVFLTVISKCFTESTILFREGSHTITNEFATVPLTEKDSQKNKTLVCRNAEKKCDGGNRPRFK